MRLATWLDQLSQDVRYGVRLLARNPGFAAIGILTIALGIGLNATLFAIFDAVALKPSSVAGSTPVVSIYQDVRGQQSRNTIGGADYFSFPEYTTYRDQNHTLSGIAAYVPETAGMIGSDPRLVHGQLVTCNYFDVLSARPELGRAFAQDECASEGAGPVVVLADNIWRDRFHADSAIIGTVVRINRVPLTVIGIAQPGFHGTELIVPAYWVPLSMQPQVMGNSSWGHLLTDEHTSWLSVIGRLKPGVSLAETRADLKVIAARLDTREKGVSTTLMVEHASLLGEPQKHRIVLAAGSAFLAAVGLVLLIACANVANLFLAMTTARQREVAVRVATGASRGRLVRQLVTESVIVSLAGGALGVLIALWSSAALVHWAVNDPSSTPLAIQVAPDWRIMAYAFALAMGTGIACGLLPALQATRPDVAVAMRQDGAEGARSGLRNSLVATQVAVCMVLLIVAGLMLRSLGRARTVDPGFTMNGVTVFNADLEREGYTAERADAFRRDLMDRVKSLPGVEAVAAGNSSPLGGRHEFVGFQSPAGGRSTVEYFEVSSGYIGTIGLPLLRGRDFNSAESESGAKVMIVNEAAARRFWPGEDPLGKALNGFRKNDYTIVGVMHDAELGELGQTHTPFLMIPTDPKDATELGTVMVRSKAAETTVATEMHDAALALDPDLHFSVAPLRNNLRPYVQGTQLLAQLAGTLGAVALFLAAIGIFGTVAHGVARRTREIGIRMALGATSPGVVGLMVRQSMRPVVFGALAGTAISAVVSRFLAPILFGVSPLDGVAFTAVPLLLASVALLASYAPARRAVRVDPMQALRAE